MVAACEPFNDYYSDLLENTTLIDIGEKYKKSTAQVTLRWCIQQNIIPIVKVGTPEHVIENSEV
jgi:diketogulonate reductase-like aldo/keto reductase